ncbi:uncharacterized protein VTP21DRAFT_4177 [Calcarisporiella thermophila]|uniref:uncharacterized protein n=1 Tax=Calcarisporiella thermophila TaxID=911321 RepID=UPI0037429D99
MQTHLYRVLIVTAASLLLLLLFSTLASASPALSPQPSVPTLFNEQPHYDKPLSLHSAPTVSASPMSSFGLSTSEPASPSSSPSNSVPVTIYKPSVIPPPPMLPEAPPDTCANCTLPEFTRDQSRAFVQLLNNISASILPDVNAKIQASMPASVGNCSMQPRPIPPMPCMCIDSNCSYLYYDARGWLYQMWARWAAGVNTILVKSASWYLSSDETQLGLEIHGVTQMLSADYHFTVCVIFNLCTPIFTAVNTCCEDNTRFTLQIVFDWTWSATSPLSSQSRISMPRVHSLTLPQLAIEPRLFGIVPLGSTDITRNVSEKLTVVSQLVIETTRFVPYSGRIYTITGLLNHLLGRSTPISNPSYSMTMVESLAPTSSPRPEQAASAPSIEEVPSTEPT